MTIKKVQYILPAEKMDMGGFPIKQALPTQKVSQVDPFLLLHHATTKYSARRPAKHQGVAPHPHKGFSPVTFVIRGEVHHRDSWGNNQIARSGEVQWMHAGKGIIHSERPSEYLAESRDHQEIVQLWINSPASSKTKIPEYTYLSEKDMPVMFSEDDKVKSKLISGQIDVLKGKIKGESPLHILWSSGMADGKETFEIPEDYNASLYLIKGSLRIEGFGLVEKENLIVFEREGKEIKVDIKEEAEFLILSAMPINEEVVQSGPYVMNSETEILRAMRDFQMGKMGILIED